MNVQINLRSRLFVSRETHPENINIAINTNAMIKIGFAHFWDVDSLESHWFFKLVKYCIDFEVNIDQTTPDVLFVSVMNSFNLNTVNQYRYRCPQGKVIFFTGENLHLRFKGVPNPLDWADFSLGFDHNDHPKYLRFPLWIMYANFGHPQLDLTDCSPLFTVPSESLIAAKTNFCTLIARHDMYGTRRPLLNLINKYKRVDCPSDLNHNCPSPGPNWNDKLNYLKTYKFNLCPENTITVGYVTEKMLHAFLSHCIPIYYGDPNPEMDIFNPAAYINVSKYPNRDDLLREIIRLDGDERAYRDMIMRPKILPPGEALINGKIQTLIAHIKTLLGKD